VDFINGSVFTNAPKGNMFGWRGVRHFTYVTGYFNLRDVGEAGYIYDIVDNGNGTSTYYEVAKNSSGGGSQVWSNVTIGSAHTYDGVGYGKPNSDNIIAQVGHTTSAANDAENLSLTGNTLLYPPTNLSYTYSSGAAFFTLFWQNNNGSGVVSNVIQYSNNGGSTWNIYGSALSGATQLQCFIAAPDSRLWRVSAVDGDGYYWSSTGIEVYCLINPTAVSVYQSFCNHVNVQWTNNNSHWVDHNELQIFSGSWTNYTSLLSGTTNSAVYFAPSTAMPIRVGVVAPDGYTQWSTAVTGTTLTVSNPQSLTAIMEGTSVRLNWTNITTIGDGIHVWRDGTDLGTLSVSATTFLDSTAIGGHTYSYSVAATCGIYSYYSNSSTILVPYAFIPHDPMTSDTYFVRFNNEALYDVILNDFEVNFQLSDIKNLSQAKTSFTLPLKIPFTPHVQKVFGALFNVTNASTITDIKIPCQLIYHDKVIIDGYSYVYYTTPDYINLVIARNDLNIFEDCGDKTLTDLQYLPKFSASTYTYRNGFNIDMLYTNVSSGFTGNTTFDHDFVMIDWWNEGNTNIPTQTQNKYGVANNCNSLFQSYPLSPVIRVKTIFDSIFEDLGYTYTASTSFMDKINRLYMTTTVPRSKYTVNVNTNYLLSGTTFYGASTAKNLYRINTHGYWCLGCTNIDNYTGNTSMGNIINNHVYDNSIYFSFPFFAGQECTISLTVYGVANDGQTGTTNINIRQTTLNATGSALQSIDDVLFGFPPVTITGSNTAKPFTVTGTFTPPADWDMSRWCVVTIDQENTTTLSRIKYGGQPDAGITITTPNFLYFTGNTYNFVDLLPHEYKYFDFLNDLLTACNMNIWADIHNIKLLHLEDSQDFNTQQVLDWTNKLTLDNFEIYDTSQQIFNQYTFNTKDGDDLISKSYQTLNSISLNEQIINNTNQLAIKESQDIRLSIPQGVLTMNLKTTNNANSPSTLVSSQAPIFTYYGGKENGACMFGYINKFIISNFLASFNNPALQLILFPDLGRSGPYIYNWFLRNNITTYYKTFSPFRLTGNTANPNNNISLAEISNPNTFAFLFNSNDTYLNITGSTITNNNLYYNFWQKDVESRIYSNQKFIKSYFRLRENELDIRNFKKKIFVSNTRIGDAYYRLNKIVFPTDMKKLAYVEMTTDLNYLPNYTGQSAINIYGYDPVTDSSYFIRNTPPVPIPPTPPVYTEYYSLQRCNGTTDKYTSSAVSGYLNNGNLVQGGTGIWYHVTLTTSTPPAGRTLIQVTNYGYGSCPNNF
jgi:hypothetical protein